MNTCNRTASRFPNQQTHGVRPNKRLKLSGVGRPFRTPYALPALIHCTLSRARPYAPLASANGGTTNSVPIAAAV